MIVLALIIKQKKTVLENPYICFRSNAAEPEIKSKTEATPETIDE